jgi:hypothetical protein
VSFTRIHTYAHTRTQQAEQEVLSRKAVAKKHNHISSKSSPLSKNAKGKSSKDARASALAVDGPENQTSTIHSPGFPAAPPHPALPQSSFSPSLTRPTTSHCAWRQRQQDGREEREVDMLGLEHKHY